MQEHRKNCKTLQVHQHTFVLMLLTNDCCCCVQAGSSGNVQQQQQRSQNWAERSLPSFLAALQQHGWELDKLFLPRPEWTAEW